MLGEQNPELKDFLGDIPRHCIAAMPLTCQLSMPGAGLDKISMRIESVCFCNAANVHKLGQPAIWQYS